MENAYSNTFPDSGTIEGIADNGLKFMGYLDNATGEIKNFFPVLKFKGDLS